MLKAQAKSNIIEQYIGNSQFIRKTGISKRTAQTWRERGEIPFVQIGAKIYQKMTDVETLLQRNYFRPGGQVVTYYLFFLSLIIRLQMVTSICTRKCAVSH